MKYRFVVRQINKFLSLKLLNFKVKLTTCKEGKLSSSATTMKQYNLAFFIAITNDKNFTMLSFLDN